jgi:hypothetical protein
MLKKDLELTVDRSKYEEIKKKYEKRKEECAEIKEEA